ncbi:33 kDa chaperonin [Thalassoporum mexicanum PCC 7367]|uniref:Hsp33 family molecular chaperone HslO n=1 Tax=Thalassoporum mexicanum TaxID=3457544 RepID=UPI00029FD9E3|nr:Hsp33 family molecular chaperone HslO [Pseudanabaena sp. PCC 7367]AFY70156.1 33 kDa chaperonin [Pseudanabaena sp. PCC 7367]
MADQLIKATAADGGIRAVAAITTNLTNEAMRRHGLSMVATAALGRTMTAGLILASSMKKPGARVNMRLSGDGPLGVVFADAGLDGTVRGYVGNPKLELPPNKQGKLDVGGAVGRNGFLYVLRDTGHEFPYSSTVELVSGEVGEDVTYYLASSEQTPSALLLGVFLDQTGVAAAGGLLLQIMPKAARDDSLIEVLEERVSKLTGFTPLLRSGQKLPQILKQMLGDQGLQIFPETQMLNFHCPCTFERVLGALRMFGEEELEDMIDKDGGAEATCNFCAEVYQADRHHLRMIINNLQREAQA